MIPEIICAVLACALFGATAFLLRLRHILRQFFGVAKASHMSGVAFVSDDVMVQKQRQSQSGKLRKLSSKVVSRNRISGFGNDSMASEPAAGPSFDMIAMDIGSVAAKLEALFTNLFVRKWWAESEVADQFSDIIASLGTVPDADAAQNSMLQRANMDEETKNYVLEMLSPEERKRTNSVHAESEYEDSGAKSSYKCQDASISSWDLVRQDSRSKRLCEALDQMDNWGTFDIFKVHSLSAPGSFFGLVFGRSIARLEKGVPGMRIVEETRIRGDTLHEFLRIAENNYCYDPNSPNPYHTAIHGADVLCTFATMLGSVPGHEELPAIDKFAAAIAALMHDYRHPGVNNQFLTNSRHELASRYVDDSVLERFHAAELLNLMAQKGTKLFSFQTHENVTHMRRIIAHMILATDLSKGVHVVEGFKKYFGKAPKKAAGTVHQRKSWAPTALVQPVPPLESRAREILKKDPKASLSLFKMLMACSDVSHPCKSLAIHMKLSALVLQEFFSQGQQEIKKSIPLSPLCKPTKDVSPSQCGFIKFVVGPKFQCLKNLYRSEAAGVSESHCYRQWVKLLQSNLQYWKDNSCSPDEMNAHAVEGDLPVIRWSRPSTVFTNQHPSKVASNTRDMEPQRDADEDLLKQLTGLMSYDETAVRSPADEGMKSRGSESQLV